MTTQLALLSDVHANLHALDAVLADIAARPGLLGPYHLGDLVGYHAFPNEVTARLRDEGIAGVAGNYDSTVAMRYKHCGCRSENPRQEELAHESFSWTLATVSVETRTTLAALPFRLDVRPLGGHVAGPTVILLHATPTSNLVYVTEDRSDDFLRKMAAQAGANAGDVIAFGHTHKPWHRLVDDVLYVNTGSVGRPKDGDPRAGWTLITLGDAAPRAEQVRVAYDIEAACAAVAAAGLPEEFAQSLRTGRA
ncbi:MAG: metallophosphoesterase family protein [Gemmatimonadaceae bacterium]